MLRLLVAGLLAMVVLGVRDTGPRQSPAPPVGADPTETLYPNGPGDRTEATPVGAATNWDCVDDDPHDSDGTYVHTNGVTTPDEDLYTLTDPAALAPDDTVNSVTVYFTIREEPASTPGDVAACIKENGVDTVGTRVAATLTYTEVSQTWTARPSDGAAWTYADILALQAGVKQVEPTVGRSVRTTLLRVAVDYTTVSVGGPVMVIVPVG
jgi:hypothetical protein